MIEQKIIDAIGCHTEGFKTEGFDFIKICLVELGYENCNLIEKHVLHEKNSNKYYRYECKYDPCKFNGVNSGDRLLEGSIKEVKPVEKRTIVYEYV